jgi:hypothetical protein
MIASASGVDSPKDEDSVKAKRHLSPYASWVVELAPMLD